METREDIARALKEAVIETFTNTLSLPPAVKEVGGRDLNTIVSGRSIVASVGFTGRMEGICIIVFTDEAAQKVVSKMLSCDLSDAAQEVFDGVGEIANILAGGVVRRCAKPNEHFDISIPSVVRVDNPLSIIEWEHTNTVHMAVDCGELKFAVSVSYVFDKKSQKVKKDAEAQEKQRIAEKYLKNLIE